MAASSAALLWKSEVMAAQVVHRYAQRAVYTLQTTVCAWSKAGAATHVVVAAACVGSCGLTLTKCVAVGRKQTARVREEHRLPSVPMKPQC